MGQIKKETETAKTQKRNTNSKGQKKNNPGQAFSLARRVLWELFLLFYPTAVL